MVIAPVMIAMTLVMAPKAAFAADVELPVIDPSSVSVSATTVAPGGQITGTFRVTDDVGCCDFNRIDMRNTAGNILLMTTPTKVSGTPTDAIYSSVISVPTSTPVGTYTLHAQATDLFGRYTHLVTLGTFQVQAAVFTPVGATVSISGETSTSVVASWSLPDEAVINRVDMAYYNYSNSQWVNLTSSTNKSGSRTISGLTPGTGYAFRTNTYYSSGVSKLGDIQFKTLDAPVVVTDTQLPVIQTSSLSLSKYTAKPGDTIVATYRITDDVACCGYNQAWMYLPTGGNIQVGGVKVSGTDKDSTFTATFTIPSTATTGSYPIKAQALDKAGRYTFLQLIGTVAVDATKTDADLPVIDPSSVSISQTTAVAGTLITGRFRVTDDVGCCKFNRIDLRTSSGAIVTMVTPTKDSGTATDAIYSGSVRIPVAASPDTFSIYAQATDLYGRYTHLVLLGKVTVSAGKPPTPVLKATTTTGSATVSWSYSFASLEKFVIRIREAAGMFTALELDSSKRSHIFSGLKDNQMYVVEMDAVSTSGETSVGSIVFTTPVKTKIAPSAPVITSYTANKLTATVSWSQENNPEAELVTGWDVQLRSSDSSTWRTLESVSNGSGSLPQVTVYDLVPGRTYFARIVARTNSGLTATSASKVVLIKYGLGTPGTLTSSNFTWNGATLSWTQPSDSVNEAPAGYRIEFSPEGSDDFSITRKVAGPAGKNSYTVSDLKAGLTYKWRVVAIGSDGTETTSAVRTFKTVSAMRSPSSLKISAFGDTWAKISWSQIANKAYKPVSTFEIRVSQDQGATWETLESGLTSTVRVVTVDDLSPETEYDVKVVALSGDGDEASASITITTMQNLDAITEATVSLVTARSAIILWELPEDPVDVEAIKTVAVEIKRSGKWVSWLRNIDPAKEKATLAKLAPKTSYEYRIVSIGDDGYKEYSPAKKFKTK